LVGTHNPGRSYPQSRGQTPRAGPDGCAHRRAPGRRWSSKRRRGGSRQPGGGDHPERAVKGGPGSQQRDPKSFSGAAGEAGPRFLPSQLVAVTPSKRRQGKAVLIRPRLQLAESDDGGDRRPLAAGVRGFEHHEGHACIPIFGTEEGSEGGGSNCCGIGTFHMSRGSSADAAVR
jgi:hypothetical protein